MARFVPVTINDRVHKLRFTIEAVEAMEVELGYGLVDLFSRQQDVRTLVLLLFYGLREHAPETTREDVRGMLQFTLDNDGDLVPIYATAVSALKASGVLGKAAQAEGRKALERPPVAGAVDQAPPASEASSPSAPGSTPSSLAPSASLD